MWNNSLRELWNITPIGRNVKWNKSFTRRSAFHTRSVFHARSAFHKSRKGFISLKKSTCDCKCFFLAPPVGLEPTTCGLTVRRSTDWAKGECLCSRYLFSRPVTRQLSSAYVCLTSVFGMGTGGPTRQSTRTSVDGLRHLLYQSGEPL